MVVRSCFAAGNNVSELRSRVCDHDLSAQQQAVLSTFADTFEAAFFATVCTADGESVVASIHAAIESAFATNNYAAIQYTDHAAVGESFGGTFETAFQAAVGAAFFSA